MSSFLLATWKSNYKKICVVSPYLFALFSIICIWDYNYMLITRMLLYME